MPLVNGSPDLIALRRWLADGQPRWLKALEELVRCESPSGDRAALVACAEVAERLFTDGVGVTDSRLVEGHRIPALVLRWGEPGGISPLLLGHLDTVWDSGSFQPLYEVTKGHAQGPGVFDMKGGVVVALAALAGLRESGGPQGSLTLLLTGDEEVGSAASRGLIEAEAARSSAVLVLEPPLGRSVKVARKGIGGYRVSVLGRAAHAGLDPEKGVNSLVAIAPLVAEVAALARPELGTTVSPTVLRAGSRTNVIPARALLEIDVRFATAAEAKRVEEGMRRLQVALPAAALEVEGGANRPPFETVSSDGIFALAREAAAELRWPELEGASVGGGSDGNFTAALGVPTLDGLGIVGGNAHAEGEWAELDSIPDRAALLAGCVTKIWEGRLS
ncbi:MAG TPA: M20 family metallopeptidase [Candidatus Acidoferrales bacterium]|nr:M20 family metallopeptidase [Candidatus Acidoferrales bacterium]